MDEYFTIVEVDDVDGMDLAMYMREVEFYLDNYQINTVSLDPWDELEHELNGLREDEYLKKWLSRIRRFARKHNVHFNIVAHPKTPQKDKNGNYLPANAYDISGGSKWYNKGEAILALHRPLEMDTGEPNTNMVKIMIQKAKPKCIGVKGVVELYLDRAKNRYYELDDVGMRRFARKKFGQYNNPETNKLQDIKPNKDF